MNIEEITDTEHTYGKRVFQDFKIKNLKSDTVYVADISENVRKMCLRIYQLGPAKFLSAPELAW